MSELLAATKISLLGIFLAFADWLISFRDVFWKDNVNYLGQIKRTSDLANYTYLV